MRWLLVAVLMAQAMPPIVQHGDRWVETSTCTPDDMKRVILEQADLVDVGGVVIAYPEQPSQSQILRARADRLDAVRLAENRLLAVADCLRAQK